MVESSTRNIARMTHHNGSARCNCTVPCLTNPGFDWDPVAQCWNQPSLSTSDPPTARAPLLTIPGVRNLKQWLAANRAVVRTPRKDAINNRIQDLKASHATLQPGTADELCSTLWALGRTSDPIGVINQTLGFVAWAVVKMNPKCPPGREGTLVSLYNTTSDTYLADAHAIEDDKHNG